jgi:hypothetical protein
MFYDGIWLKTLKSSNKVPVIYRRIRTRIRSFLLVLASVAIVGPASALTLYDGDWSVVIVTRSGACDPSYRVDLQIVRGAVDSGGLATVQGQVTPTGGVKVTVRSGNQRAYGSGLLNKNQGRGVWRGQGKSGACRGTWAAARRG